MSDAVSGPLFSDRSAAGRMLARSLEDERHPDTVVIGLARGGVPVAAELARLLRAPLDAVAVRKVRHPRQPEYAVGAVTPSGAVFLRSRNGLSDDQIALAVTDAQARAVELDRLLHAGRSPSCLRGRRALVVDDGLATGATMVAAVRWARSRGAIRVVAAAPVASAQAIVLLQGEADRVVCPHLLRGFGAVGECYADFHQVDDEEVLCLLDAKLGPASTGPNMTFE
jgi:putative phosphoribosyl transferase